MDVILGVLIVHLQSVITGKSRVLNISNIIPAKSNRNCSEMVRRTSKRDYFRAF